MTAFPIAIELLDAELDRLEQDHYSDDKYTDCDGCKRAFEVRDEIRTLENKETLQSAE